MALTETQRQKLLDRITKPATTRIGKFVFYGAPGTGKTVTATSVHESNLLIMTEMGDNVLTKPEHKHLFDNTMRVPFISINSVRAYVELVSDPTVPYEHLIIDNMSGVQDKKLSENMSEEKVQKLARAHPDLSTLQDYQIIAHQMRPMMVDLMDLEKQTTIICHLRPADPDRKEYESRPDLTKAIFNLANEKANVVARFYKDNSGNRFVQTLGDSAFVAKSQITDEHKKIPINEFIAQINAWRNSL